MCVWACVCSCFVRARVCVVCSCVSVCVCVLERIMIGVCSGIYFAGLAIGFYRGDYTKVFDDMYALKPTFMIASPGSCSLSLSLPLSLLLS